MVLSNLNTILGSELQKWNDDISKESACLSIMNHQNGGKGGAKIK